MEENTPDEMMSESIETSINTQSHDVSRPEAVIIDESTVFDLTERVEPAEEVAEEEAVEEESAEEESVEEESVEEEAVEEEAAEEEGEEDVSAIIEWETKKGEKFSASEQDLKSAYCLYDENKKRMTALSEEKKELEAEISIARQTAQFNEKLSGLEGNDLLVAILDQAHAINPKVEAAMEAFYSNIYKEANVTATMNPEQRAAYDKEKRLAYFEQQEQQREQQNKFKQEEDYKSSARERIKTEWSVDDALVSEANRLAVNRGFIDETTPLDKSVKVVEGIIADYVYENRAKEILNAINPDLVGDISNLDELVEWQFRNPRAEQKALEQRAKKLFGSEAREQDRRPSRSAKKTGKKKAPKRVLNFYGNEGKDNIVY